MTSLFITYKVSHLFLTENVDKFMPANFFDRALKAAEDSIDDFDDLIESEKEKLNQRQGYFHGPYLIHCIIKQFDDTVLPALLGVLIKHGVHLEVQDESKKTPLVLAAYHLKINAVTFLIDQKAKINTENPPLIHVIESCDINAPEELKFNLVKLFLENGANVNAQYSLEQTPLMLAAENGHLTIVELLKKWGADISIIVSNFGLYNQDVTAISLVYEKLLCARSTSSSAPNALELSIQNFQHILDYLFSMAKDHLYRQFAPTALSDQELRSQMYRAAYDIAGNVSFASCYQNYTSPLRSSFFDKVAKPVIDRIMLEREQRHAFEMGSQLNVKQLDSIHRFFQRNNGRDLVTHIFTFVHEATAHMESSFQRKKR